MICRRRVGSPSRYGGTSNATLPTNSSPWSNALTPSISRMPSISACKSKGMVSNSSSPASIFEISRMSLIRIRSVSPARLKISTYSRCSLFSSVSESRSAIPMIAFMGVRISWLMFARKLLLAAFASSASFLAFFRESSACLRPMQEETPSATEARASKVETESGCLANIASTPTFCPSDTSG